MKAILYFDEGSKVIVDVLLTPPRKERETQREYENRVADIFNQQVFLEEKAEHKVVRVKLMRN